MLIDFHTHIYPEEIAQRAIPHLAKKAGIPYYGLGTAADLLNKFSTWNLSGVVAANIVTSELQHKKVNDFAISVNSRQIQALGSVYPGSPQVKDELKRIKKAGLKGIKLHPEYQSFNINDKKAYPIYEKCEELGLFILFHTGRDPGFPNDYRGKPEYLAEIAQDFPKNIFIAGHLGGLNAWDEALEFLCSKENIYFDTAFIAKYLPQERAKKIIREFGAPKILFATDYPWETVPVMKEYILGLGLNEKELEEIFYKNAARLLKL